MKKLFYLTLISFVLFSCTKDANRSMQNDEYNLTFSYTEGQFVDVGIYTIDNKHNVIDTLEYGRQFEEYITHQTVTGDFYAIEIHIEIPDYATLSYFITAQATVTNNVGDTLYNKTHFLEKDFNESITITKHMLDY